MTENQSAHQSIPLLRSNEEQLAKIRRQLEGMFRELRLVQEGLALFAGLNAFPKKSYLSEYSSRITHAQTTTLLGAYQRQIAGDELLPGHSFNLDFHSVPYHGEHPVVEQHYVSMRSRSQKSILIFLAQDAD
jgi:hypothetical protein